MKNLRIVNVRMVGINGETRYSKPKEECVFFFLFGEECNDELKAEVFEAGGTNDHCITVEDLGTNARRVGCALLHM